MVKTRIKKFIRIAITSQFLFFSLLSTATTIYSAEMPNAQDIKNSIVQQATTKTASINADTSSATQATTPPPAPQTETKVRNTGDNTNTNTTSNSNSTTGVNNQNNTDVNQTINAEANTGRNKANGNISINGTGAGVIQTGDATVNASGTVNAGSNTTAISGGSGSGGASSDVVNTGNNVSTTTTDNATTTTLVNNGNTTVIHQSANVKANTGDNEASGNIAIGGGPAGAIVTGNASTNTNFLVTGGGNVTLIGGTGNGSGPGNGASIILANTGNYGRFTTTSNTNHYTVVNNSNRAVISQMCGRPISQREVLVDTAGCIANTGGNKSNGNINKNGDAGVINTGDAVLNVTLVADANNNSTGIQNTGAGGGGASSDVINTGDNVGVNTTSNANSTTQVNNTNSARVDQTVNARANTGDNEASGNISFGGCAGCITTGNATVNVNLVTNVNKNDTAIIGSGGGPQGNSNSTSNIVNTGDNVNVTTTSNNNNTTAVNNTNELTIAQRVWSLATTGLNRALGNIGNGISGLIITGNATTSVNENVNANTNSTIIDPDLTPTNPPSGAPTPTITVTQADEIADPAPTNTPPVSVGGPGPATQNNNPPAGSPTSISDAVNRGGSVLGTALAVLPATGPELAIWTIVASLLSLLVGTRLRQYNNQNTL